MLITDATLVHVINSTLHQPASMDASGYQNVI